MEMRGLNHEAWSCITLGVATDLSAWPRTTWSNRWLLTEVAEANCRHFANAVNAKAIGSYEAILYLI